jgi:hypothetical protein
MACVQQKKVFTILMGQAWYQENIAAAQLENLLYYSHPLTLYEKKIVSFLFTIF